MSKLYKMYLTGAVVSMCQFSALNTAGAQELVPDDLITGSSQTSAWLECTTDSLAVDVSLLDAGGCAYRETPAEPGLTYRMSCGVTPVKFASVTLAFLDADFNTLATETTPITDDVAGVYGVTLQSPPGTANAAIGIYGEAGSGFQDCVLIDATPAPEPTKGSIAGVSWFDASGDSLLDANESRISGTSVSLVVNGEVITQTETGSNGAYFLGNLDVEACYSLVFAAADSTLQLGVPGQDNDADANGSTAEICLTEQIPDITNVDVGFVAVPPAVPPADNTICGRTWADLNADGVLNAGDERLANIKVMLLDADGNMVDMLESTGSGDFAFNDLVEGSYQVKFTGPDGFEPTIASGQPSARRSYIDAEGRTAIFTIPNDSNTLPDSACTIRGINAGYIRLPVALDPTIANDDEASFDVGTNFNVDVLANDMACDGVNTVDLLGHNVPGQVTFDAQAQQFVVSNTTAPGTYSIDYGVRGNCGSYDTATVLITLAEVIPPAPPAAPDAPICRVETGGNSSNGGVDVFHPEEFGFTPTYNLYDRNRNLVVNLSSTDFTHKILVGPNSGPNELPFIGNYEIEWNGTNYGYDQVSIHFAAAVENGIESELTQCVRDNFSPIALDLDNHGRVARIAGTFSVDLDSDGVDEKLSEWFAPSAGILVTADAKGKINGDQLFGNVPGKFKDGFEELATRDHNRDDQLTKKELDGLAIWNDRNSDTVVNDGELSSLASHGIRSLAVTHYKFMARAQLANGKSILMEDVWLPMSVITVSEK